MDKPTSKTERDTNLVERLTNDSHYKATITDGTDTAVGEGKTPERAEERASERWKDRS